MVNCMQSFARWQLGCKSTRSGQQHKEVGLSVVQHCCDVKFFMKHLRGRVI